MADGGYIDGQQGVRGRKSVNTSEYALQMCRPVTLQVNTIADGQLGTGWPHRPPPRERESGRRVEEGELGGGGSKKWWVKEERRGLCAGGPEPRVTPRTCVAWQAGDRGRQERGATGGREEEEEKKEGEREKNVHGRRREREGGIAREDWA